MKLLERYTVDDIRAGLRDPQDWFAFPAASDRAAWEGLLVHPLNQARKARLVARAEAALGQPWPFLPAERYMDFGRNGNRRNYEAPYFERRQRLAALVLAEAFEMKGRFIDEIINGIWVICEETTWIIPAHSTKGPKGVLPSLDAANQAVDLFACETAAILGLIYRLVGPQLDVVSPVVTERMRQQMNVQVLEPIEAREDIRWMSGNGNWTPWCCSNTLIAALAIWEDADRVAAMARKLMTITDRFIDRYPPDGGCNEGPRYWGVAAGAMFNLLEFMYVATDGAVDIYSEPLIVAMGDYMVTVNLDADYFVNFADAPIKPRFREGNVYHFGTRTGNALMQELVGMVLRGGDPKGEVSPLLQENINGGDLLFHLQELFWVPGDAAPQGLPRPTERYLPDLQVAVLRESEQWGKGLVFAIKGGHNGENHNHNDVGQFIVMSDSRPLIVDPGSETYTRSTFGPERYTHWYIGSRGHNVPVVNGCEQAPGAEHAASQVVYDPQGRVYTFSEDIAGAYPAEADLKKLVRTAVVDWEARSVSITDAIACSQSGIDLDVWLHSPLPMTVVEPGVLALGEFGRICYDAALLDVRLEVLPLVDPIMRNDWGDTLYRAVFSLHTAADTAAYTLVIRPA